MMELRKLANHPLLVRSQYDDDTITKMAEVLCREVSSALKCIQALHAEHEIRRQYKIGFFLLGLAPQTILLQKDF